MKTIIVVLHVLSIMFFSLTCHSQVQVEASSFSPQPLSNINLRLQPLTTVLSQDLTTATLKYDISLSGAPLSTPFSFFLRFDPTTSLRTPSRTTSTPYIIYSLDPSWAYSTSGSSDVSSVHHIIPLMHDLGYVYSQTVHFAYGFNEGIKTIDGDKTISSTRYLTITIPIGEMHINTDINMNFVLEFAFQNNDNNNNNHSNNTVVRTNGSVSIDNNNLIQYHNVDDKNDSIYGQNDQNNNISINTLTQEQQQQSNISNTNNTQSFPGSISPLPYDYSKVRRSSYRAKIQNADQYRIGWALDRIPSDKFKMTIFVGYFSQIATSSTAKCNAIEHYRECEDEYDSHGHRTERCYDRTRIDTDHIVTVQIITPQMMIVESTAKWSVHLNQKKEYVCDVKFATSDPLLIDWRYDIETNYWNYSTKDINPYYTNPTRDNTRVNNDGYKKVVHTTWSHWKNHSGYKAQSRRTYVLTDESDTLLSYEQFRDNFVTEKERNRLVGIIVGSVLGGIVILVIIAVLFVKGCKNGSDNCYCCTRSDHSRQKTKKPTHTTDIAIVPSSSSSSSPSSPSSTYIAPDIINSSQQSSSTTPYSTTPYSPYNTITHNNYNDNNNSYAAQTAMSSTAYPEQSSCGTTDKNLSPPPPEYYHNNNNTNNANTYSAQSPYNTQNPY